MQIRPTHSVLATVLLLGMSMNLTGCSKGPKELIVGKWQGSGTGGIGTVEFTQDGKVTVSMMGQSMSGAYKFTDDANIQIDLTILGQKQSKTGKVSFPDPDTMTMEADGKPDTLKRVK